MDSLDIRPRFVAVLASIYYFLTGRQFVVIVERKVVRTIEVEKVRVRYIPRTTRKMTREEALKCLDCVPGASRDDITKGYRKALQAVHPDHGGNRYFTQLVLEAKQVLLG